MLAADKIHLFFFFFFVTISASPSTNPDYEDFTTLQSFKSSSSAAAAALTTWSTATSPCSSSAWLGVTCNPVTHRVTKLVLENLNLTGSISHLHGLSQLRSLSLKNNHFSSASTVNFSSWPNLKHLYLSHNRFSGLFPDGISGLRHLRRLDLSYNHFYGAIPMSELGGLPRLLTLRLEVNSFTGVIDPVNSLSSSVLDFNVSSNFLSGDIPSWLSRFPASSFAGNEGLCGEPLRGRCTNETVESEPAESGGGKVARKRRLSHWVVILIAGADAAAVAAAVLTIICCCCYRNRRRNNGDAQEGISREKPRNHGQSGRRHYYGEEGEKMVVFEGCKGLNKVEDLLKSSAELLGKGCVGTTYKVEMDGGDAVVVKRVRGRKRRREVDVGLKIIGGLRHPNVVSLRAFFNCKDELLLVYDFLPNGSLHSLLHGNRGPGRTPLDWSTRLKLASGSAKGLAFLHFYNQAKLFHGNLTSSNIIVDHMGNACVSDIGLHQLLHPNYSLSNDPYKAPELIPNHSTQRKYTQKCDVYSFGVILVEVLTGKMPSGGDDGGETSLVKWVQRVGQEKWNCWEVFDFELVRYKETEEEMVALMQVALLCLAPLPRDRPKMSIVHGMIEDIRTKGARQGGPSSILNDLSCDSSPSQSENRINFGINGGT